MESVQPLEAGIAKLGGAYAWWCTRNQRSCHTEPLKAGRGYEYTIPRALWHIKKHVDKEDDLIEKDGVALEVASSMLAGCGHADQDLNRKNQKSLVCKLAKSLQSHDGVHHLSKFVLSDAWPSSPNSGSSDGQHPKEQQMVASLQDMGQQDHSAQLQDSLGAIAGQQRGAGQRAGGVEHEGATRQSSDSSLEEEEAGVGAGNLECDLGEQGGEQIGGDGDHGGEDEEELGESVPLEPPSRIPLLLLNVKKAKIKQLSDTLEHNVKKAQVEFAGEIEEFQKKMPATVGTETVMVDMEVLWEAAVELKRSKRKQKTIFDYCQKLGASTPGAFSSKPKTWKGVVYELWDKHLEPLAACGQSAIKPLLHFEAVPWDGVKLPTPEEALESARAAFRASKAAAAGKTSKKTMKNLVHNKTCSNCGKAGQGNNRHHCGGCGHPLLKPGLASSAEGSLVRSLPKESISTIAPLRSSFRPVVNAVDKFCQSAPGASAFAIAVVPVIYPSAATSSASAGPEVTNLMFDMGPLAPSPAADMLVGEYAGLKILVMRHASDGESAAGGVVNSASLMSAVLVHAKAAVKKLLEEAAKLRVPVPQEVVAVPTTGSEGVLVATEADKEVAIGDVLEKAGVSTEVVERLKAEEIDDMWNLKKLLRADNITYQKDLGLNFRMVQRLKEALSKA